MKTSWEIEFDEHWHSTSSWNMSPHDSSLIKAFIQQTINQSIQADRKRLAKSWTTEGHQVVCMADVLEIINSNFLKE